MVITIFVSAHVKQQKGGRCLIQYVVGCTHIEAREEGIVENIVSFKLSQRLRASDLFLTLQDDFFVFVKSGLCECQISKKQSSDERKRFVSTSTEPHLFFDNINSNLM